MVFALVIAILIVLVSLMGTVLNGLTGLAGLTGLIIGTHSVYGGASSASSASSAMSAPAYPYKRLYMSDAEVMERFARLREYEMPVSDGRFSVKNLRDVPATKLMYNGQYQLVEVRTENYEKYDNLSDYFQEHVRVNCRRVDQSQSPLEYWRSHTQYGRVDLADPDAVRAIRDQLFAEHYECTTFKPSLMVGFGKKFGATSILDISAGWGDRLIGALALGVPYVGVDPNADLHAGYTKMIRTFADAKARKDYVVINDTFQKAKLPKRAYDLVFTSPPYFNLEKYALTASEAVQKKQSDYGLTNVSEWLNGFLFVSLAKAWAALTVGGHMIININEFRGGEPFIARMLAEVNGYPDALYLGCIGQYTADRGSAGRDARVYAQPFWVWRKVAGLPTRETYNPALVIEDVSGVTGMRIVRDDLLIGGSKQRGVVPMFDALAARGLREVVYVSPTTGFAQIALSLGSKITGLRSTVFMARDRPMKPQTIQALRLGGNIIEGDPRARMRELRERASRYVAEDPKGREEFYLGFDSDDFRTAMRDSIIAATVGTDMEKRASVDTIWVAGGSAVLANILAEVFPKAHIHVVQVGKDIAGAIDTSRMTLHIAPEGFYDDARELPPYPSLTTYDAKVWQFARAYEPRAGERVYIWNVAGDITLDKK